MALPTLGAGPSSGLRYLLRATFDAANQGYVNGVTYSLPANGIQDGTLTVVEVDGTLAIVSNKLAFTAQATPTWGDLGAYSQAITRALGRGFMCSTALTAFRGGISWMNAQALNLAAWDHGVHIASVTGAIVSYIGGVASVTVGTMAAATNYELAIVLGGYDTNGLPYYAGQTQADYTYGYWVLVKGGVYTTWTLLWQESTINTATLYAGMSNAEMVGTLDDLRVPDKDLSAIQVPVAYSSFTAPNGTSLDAITPEVGGAWTEQLGDWDIQGNKADCDGVGVATLNAGIADGVFDVVVRRSAAGDPGIILRYTDVNTFWQAQANDSGNLELYENDSGFTIRATAAVTFNVATDYSLRAIADGRQIDVFLDGANKISYGSAALNETETTHGVKTSSADTTCDNFTVYPRTSAQYDAVLDSV